MRRRRRSFYLEIGELATYIHDGVQIGIAGIAYKDARRYGPIHCGIESGTVRSRASRGAYYLQAAGRRFDFGFGTGVKELRRSLGGGG